MNNTGTHHGILRVNNYKNNMTIYYGCTKNIDIHHY